MPEQITSNFDELEARIGQLDDYARGITGDTKAPGEVLSTYRQGFADSPYGEVGDLLSQGREARERAGANIAKQARGQAQFHRNTITGFADADSAAKTVMDKIADE